MNLDIKIEDLLSADASNFAVATEIKNSFNSYRNSLSLVFEKEQGKSFLVKHTREIDRYIKVIFKYALRKHFGEFLPLINTLPITIATLGSHAREQLSIYSDIDIMIVYKKTAGYNLEPIIETILQIAWDSGLKLGHRVHQIDDLSPASKEDHTIKSALIESRYLCGSKYLWMNIESILGTIRKTDQKKFISAKIDERNKRWKKYPFHLQPDIKLSPGGLRDINTLFWIANTLYGVKRIKDLCPAYISENEYGNLMKSIELLFKIRTALHLSVGKKQDRLIFQYIPDVANILKISHIKLLQKCFEAMGTINLICDYITEKITNNLHISPKKENIEYFVDLFLQSDDANQTYDISYIYNIHNSKKSRTNPKKIKKIFYKKHIYSFLMALYRSKQLNTTFPILAKISHYPQFDRYHKYPVDIHSIRTVLSLENIQDQNVLKVYNSLSDEEKALIKAIALIHDSGKGRKKDHSLLGSVIAKNYMLELGFSYKHQEYAYLLVRYHTLMSNISTREDIYSEKIIYSFISKLKEEKILKLLYVLTYADIESVYAGAYSSFNAKLLYELYTISNDAFENKKLISEATKRTKKENKITNTTEFRTLSKSLQKKILAIESNLLFFKYKAQRIIRVAKWINELNKDFDYIITNTDTLTIEIVRKKSINLGYMLARLNNLNITTMDVFKFFKNTKYFKIEFMENVEDFDIQKIESIIENSFDMSKITKQKPLDIKSKEIKINCNHSKSYAMMSVNAKNQPALLSNIMSIFDDMGIDIASAKIQTIKSRARNLFLIEKNGNFCINKERVVNQLIKGI